MTRHRRLPYRSLFAAACFMLALGTGATARAADEIAHEAPEKPASPAAAEHDASHASPPTMASIDKPAARSTKREEPHGLLNLGASLTERGQYEEAEIAYRQVLNGKDTGETEIKSALLGLAHMHRKKGDPTRAVAIYERYLKEYSSDERTPDALLALGRTYRDLGAYKPAIARFYSVINSTLRPALDGLDHYQVLAKTAQFEIAETHFQSGDFASAAKFYTKFRLLDIAPEDRARAHFKAGYALRLQGNLEGAVTGLRAYIAQWQNDENVPEARYLLAVSLRELKRTQEALAETLELLRTEKSRVSSNPKRWTYWQSRTGNQLANDFFESGDTLNARAIYAALLELSPDLAWRIPITYQLGLCYERLGMTDRAKRAYQTIVETTAEKPMPEVAELAKMSAWRIEHLDWRENAGQEISKFFESTTGKQAISLPAETSAKAASTP